MQVSPVLSRKYLLSGKSRHIFLHSADIHLLSLKNSDTNKRSKSSCLMNKSVDSVSIQPNEINVVILKI